MANPTSTISQSFEKLRESLSIEHRHSFSSTVLQDVWDEVLRIESVQRKRQSAQNLRRIEPFLRGLEKYSKVIEVLCNGTPYLPFIWAPIKLMLQLASNHRDIFEALLDAYVEIGNAFPRFDRYETAFKDNSEFQSILAGVYSTILEFHQRAYKFFQRRAFHLIFMSLWKDFRARFNGILHTLEKHRDFVDREAHSINMIDQRDARTRILAKIEDISERQRQTTAILESNEKSNHLGQFHSSLSWLSANDKIQEAGRFQRAAKKHSGTCEWIVDEPRIKSWLKDDDLEPVVWLNGKPGAGKSVMCTVILETLDGLKSPNVCYYFCNNQDDGSDNPSERVLGIIAIQLLRAHPDLASLITNEFLSHGSSSGLAQLRILVPKLLQLQPYTRIVVDGIDECSKDGQKALLKELQNICLSPNLRTKALISSRKEPNIKTELSSTPKVSLDEHQKVELDIQQYVAHKIQEIQTNFGGGLQPDVFTQIASSVAEKADGMFLWVKLITQELEQCFNRRDLEQCAQRLPHGLKEAYGRILDRMLDEEVPPRVRNLSMRILEWMSCSFRRLKMHVILDGVSISPESPSVNHSTKLQKKVLDLCRPLVEDGPSDTLVFVHFSAQQYILEAAHKQGTPFIRPKDAHLNIGFSCVSYMNKAFCLLPQNSSEHDRVLEILQGFHGLQVYANRYWHLHIIAYLDQIAAKTLQVPDYLIQQLKEIIKYSKVTLIQDRAERFCGNSQCGGICNTDRFASLQNFSGLACLVAGMETFRSGLKKQDWTQKSADIVSLETNVSDPSWFSSTRYYYQSILETLIISGLPSSSSASAADKEALRIFRDTYSDSAFVCRYSYCNRAKNGFNTMKDRGKHEAQHRREYRCESSTCAEFGRGFPTRAQLTRHNGKYHAFITDGSSLGDEIRALKRRKTEQEVHRGLDHFDESTGQAPGLNIFQTQWTIDAVDEEPYTIKCICGFSDDDGNTIYCETCDTWQHIECFYPGRVADASREEFDHSCADCKPRALDRRHAAERQRHQRQNKASNDSGDIDSNQARFIDVDSTNERRNIQQVSSHWSVPEQTSFPALLGHFGTDWKAIAKHMTSKNHIMVKNYYQRSVDSGKSKEWKQIAREADEKKLRGDASIPPPPPPITAPPLYGSSELDAKIDNHSRVVDTSGASASPSLRNLLS